MQSTTQKEFQDQIPPKLKSRIEVVISLCFIVVVLFLLEVVGRSFDGVLDAKFGNKVGYFVVFVVYPICLLVSMIVVLLVAYFIISKVYGKRVAGLVIFRVKS